MESSALYHIKQQFILGAYKTLTDLTLPPEPSIDYIPTLVYKSRAHIALNEPESALQAISSEHENVAVKAVASLARYVGAKHASAAEAALEELRDLSIEIEGDEAEGSEKDKASVRVIAATAFARAGEIEEALDTLGTETQDLEAVYVIVQLYLLINRTDLAKKQFERARKWAEDDLLLQLIESIIGLATGKDGYSNASSFYAEQLANPSLSSPHILTARGVARILRNETQEAKSDLEEAMHLEKSGSDALAGLVVAAGLGAMKKAEAEQLWVQLAQEYPTHAMVIDISHRSDLFDEFAANFKVPSVA